MSWKTSVNNAAAYYDFLGFVISAAPDFPEEDYLEPHEQLTTRLAFEILRSGLSFFPRVRTEKPLRARLIQLLDESESAFAEERWLDATTRLQRVDDILLGREDQTVH